MNYCNFEENTWIDTGAAAHIDYTLRYFKKETDQAISDMEYFPHCDSVPESMPTGHAEAKVMVTEDTSVDVIYQYFDADSHNVCMLDFASYRVPGGRFLEGVMTQEGSLCHESNLFSILDSKEAYDFFYDQHNPEKDTLNRQLYRSDLLYIPKVTFVRDCEIMESDVIVCAAPDKKLAQIYRNVTDHEATETMAHRIDSILHAANEKGARNLILGSFGCGGHGYSAAEVAGIFRELLHGKYAGCFDLVIFPVPDHETYGIMKKILADNSLG